MAPPTFVSAVVESQGRKIFPAPFQTLGITEMALLAPHQLDWTLVVHFL